MTRWALFLLAAASLPAQQADQPDDNPAPSRSVTLASQFFEHDFFNLYAFGNGIYDTGLPLLVANHSVYGSGWGWQVGGGLTLGHSFREGSLTLAYRGDYRDYVTSTYGAGSDQNLSLEYSKRLNRRWSVSLFGAGGIVYYGGSFYSVAPSASAAAQTNPLSARSRFANAGLTLAYQQTRRLSYEFSGDFFLNNYSYAGAINSVGGAGAASLLYRTTSRTTIGATYSHTYFTYGHSSGTTAVDGGYLTLSHNFPEHWVANLSVGVSHSHSQGTITLPVSLLLGQQIITGYVTGPYNRSINTPSLQATITRYLRHSSISVSGGQGVVAGNGTYLASRDQFVNAVFSDTWRRSNFSMSGAYYRLSSISNSVSQIFATSNFAASYGYVLRRYLSANFRYDFLHYDGVFAYNGLNENRLSFGFSVSTKSVPLTLF